MKKLLVYPGSPETEVFMQYKLLLREVDKVILAGPKGWHTPGHYSNHKPLPSFEEVLPECTRVLFLETEPRLQDFIYEQKLKLALHNKKDICIAGSPEFLKNIDIPSHMLCRVENEEFNCQFDKNNVEPIYEIPVPVIYVLGLGPNTGKFNVQLVLRNFFLRKGYSIAQVGSKVFSSFFGFSPFPSVFEDQKLSIHQRIVAFNRYVYKKYTREKPDVMIIGIPGGIFPINSVMFEDMGEKAFLACQAVRPDSAVLCSYAHPFNSEYIGEIRQICKYRLNFNLRYFAVSATSISILPDTQKSEYTFYSPEAIEHEFLANKQYDQVELYNVFKPDDMLGMCNSILSELKNNY